MPSPSAFEIPEYELVPSHEIGRPAERWRAIRQRASEARASGDVRHLAPAIHHSVAGIPNYKQSRFNMIGGARGRVASSSNEELAVGVGISDLSARAA